MWVLVEDMEIEIPGLTSQMLPLHFVPREDDLGKSLVKVQRKVVDAQELLEVDAGWPHLRK